MSGESKGSPRAEGANATALRRPSGLSHTKRIAPATASPLRTSSSSCCGSPRVGESDGEDARPSCARGLPFAPACGARRDAEEPAKVSGEMTVLGEPDVQCDYR